MAKEPDLSFFDKYKPAKGNKTEIKREKIPSEPDMRRIYEAAYKVIDADAEAYKKLKAGGGKGAPPKTGFGLDEDGDIAYWPRFGSVEWDILNTKSGIKVGSDDEDVRTQFIKDLKAAVKSGALNDQLKRAYKAAAEKKKYDKEQKEAGKAQRGPESKSEERASGKANPVGKPK